MTTATHQIRITWVFRGTRDAAMLGLDDTVEAESLEAAIDAAEYHAQCQNIDLDEFEVQAEFVA
jgi:hypothetical protein